MATYPDPDLSFRASPLTNELILRFKQYCDGREPLPGMAYWMLTRLEEEYGGRRGAAQRLRAHYGVLDKLGELTSTVADPEIGRKAKGSQKNQYTEAELKWMEGVVVRLIRRVGELNVGGKNLQEIALGDFPCI